MCVDYSLLLSEINFELDNLHNKAIKDKTVVSEGLQTFCKFSILNEYITEVKNLSISIVGFFQSLRLINDKDTLIYKFKLLRKIYKSKMFYSLYLDSNISSILVFLFEIFETSLEKKLFDKIEDDLLNLLELKNNNNDSIDEQKLEILDNVFDFIYEFAETSVFILSGLRIDVDNVNLKIFEDDKFNFKEKNIKLDDENLGWCKKELEEKESIYLIMTPWVLLDSETIECLIYLFTKYHKNPKNICLVLDYIFMEKNYKMNVERLIKISQHMKYIYVTNYEHLFISEIDRDYLCEQENLCFIKSNNLEKAKECADISEIINGDNYDS